MKIENRINRTTVSNQIFQILKEKIISHEWSVGEKIPSETELAKEYYVSRLSARTAIQKLAALGLVEIRVGDGTYIKKHLLDDFIGEGSRLIMSIQMQDEMSEFRVSFEKCYTEIACLHRTEEDIQKISMHLENMRKEAEKGSVEGFTKHDILFHRAICEATKNPCFILVYRLMEEKLIEHYKDTTMACAEAEGMSTNVNSPNFYLRVIANGHGDYLKSLETRDPSISILYTEKYQDIFKIIRHPQK